MVMAVRVFFLFCRTHLNLRWNDDDTGRHLLSRDPIDAWFETIINVTVRECTHCSVFLGRWANVTE